MLPVHALPKTPASKYTASRWKKNQPQRPPLAYSLIIIPPSIMLVKRDL